jgi:thiamine biosynthesis lipoprotein
VVNFSVWGLSGTLSTQFDEHATFAQERLWYWINEFDDACNRFRPDSEISRLNAQPGTPFEVSDTFVRCLDAGLLSARLTNGLCDPTVLKALLALGYDRDYDEISHEVADTRTSHPSPGIEAIAFDRDRRSVTLRPGCALDLGASAKALLADVVADELAPLGGVVVEIGGDVALRGRGSGGPWVVGVSDKLTLRGDEPRVSQEGGGIATSSTTARVWRSHDATLNHIIDPRTGQCANGPFATATVSAASCVVANAFATAALLWDEDASYHIAQAGWSARLVRRDGTVEFVGGWPEEQESA